MSSTLQSWLGMRQKLWKSFENWNLNQAGSLIEDWRDTAEELLRIPMGDHSRSGLFDMHCNGFKNTTDVMKIRSFAALMRCAARSFFCIADITLMFGNGDNGFQTFLDFLRKIFFQHGFRFLNNCQKCRGYFICTQHGNSPFEVIIWPKHSLLLWPHNISRT